MNVYIVCGAPASGKTTHVRENMIPGDMVVDLDLIKQSISMQGKTEASDNLLDVALNIREFLYYVIENRDVDCENVWVVAGLPKERDREELKNRLDAKIIFKNINKQECIRRAMNDDERLDKDMQVQIIDKWFYLYEKDQGIYPPYLEC